jgi:hypothetical protein
MRTSRSPQTVGARALGGNFGDVDQDQDAITEVILSRGNVALPPLVEVLVRVREENTIKVVKPPGVDELWVGLALFTTPSFAVKTPIDGSQ